MCVKHPTMLKIKSFLVDVAARFNGVVWNIVYLLRGGFVSLL